MSWLKQYCQQLKIHPERPSLSFLATICQAHLTTYPFENISKLIYYYDQQKNGFIHPSHKLFLENHQRYDFGGTCYTLHTNLLHLLKKLGFRASFTMLGKSHVAILVRLPNKERVYIDCGSAAPLFKPIHFETDPDNISQFGQDQVKIRPHSDQPGYYVYLRYRNGILRPESKEWVFHPDHPCRFHDLLPAIQESMRPGTFFMSMLRCQLWQLDQNRSVSLKNNQFLIQYADGSYFEHTLTSLFQLKEALKEEFRLPKLPVEKAIHILESLGIDPFAKSVENRF
jgi:N-hydroxyarylamine O-acetyltransferase